MKIQCACGTKYSFDITAEMAQAPIRFVCSSCGADNSETINQLVRQQLGLPPAAISSGCVPATAPPPTSEPVVVRVNSRAASLSMSPAQVLAPAASVAAAHATATPPLPRRVQVSVQKAAVAVAAATETAPAVDTPQACLKHPGQLTTNRCVVCEKPICPKCMELFGYVCSALCKGRAESLRMELPVYGQQKATVEAKRWRRVGLSVLVFSLLLLSGGGFWIWYKYSGSVPKRLLTARFEDGAFKAQASFITGKDLLTLHGGTLSRHDLKAKAKVWSQTLIDKRKIAEEAAQEFEKRNAAGQNARNSSDFSEAFRPASIEDLTESLQAAAAGALHLYVRGQNIWVSHANKLVRYDWATGQAAKEFPFKSTPLRLVPRGQEMLVLTAGESSQTVTHIDLAEGTSRSEEIASPGATSLSAIAVNSGTPNLKPADQSANAQSARVPIQLRLSKPAVQAVKANQQRALEEMKDKPDPAPLASSGRPGIVSSNLLLPTGPGFVQLWVRPLGNEGENGRCQVGLKRFGISGANDWTGETASKPQLFPLQTMDILVAGRDVYAFDRSNKKLWESKLNHDFAGTFREVLAGEVPPFGEGPVVEKGDTLYVFDDGELSALDPGSGKARWRFAAMHIAGLHFDGQGGIYLNTSTEHRHLLESLRHVDVPEETALLVEKVDAKTGALVWKVEREGLVRYVSGHFLYTVASQKGDPDELNMPMPTLNTGFQKIPHIRIKRLDMRDGQVMWEHYHGHTPLDVGFERNTIAILCKQEMQVLKFFAF